MIRKIFAIVSEKDYFLFREKAYRSGRDIGKAFADLATAFARGNIEIKGKKVIQQNTYLEGHDTKGGK